MYPDVGILMKHPTNLLIESIFNNRPRKKTGCFTPNK